MKSKLGFLIGISLKRKIKTKWFVLANALLALLIVGAMNIDSIITFFGGDFDKKTKVYVIDQTEQAFDIFKEQLLFADQNDQKEDQGEKEKESSYEIIKSDKKAEEAKKMVEEEKDSIVVILAPDAEKTMQATIVSKGYLNAIRYQMVSNAINSSKVALAMLESDITAEQLNAIYDPVTIERIYLDKNSKDKEENMNMIMSMIFPVFILPFFMLSIFLIQMIGAEVNDEKTTRGMEIIISNVSPKVHFFAKVIAGNLFVLLQGLLLLIFAGLGMGIRYLFGGGDLLGGMGGEIGGMINELLSSGLGEKLIYIIPLALVLMILTFIGYSLLAGILASMTTNIEDFQQLQTPIIIISLVGYFLAMMAGLFEGSIFIRILGYVPFISAILSPSLLFMGHIGIIDVVIAIAIMVVTIYVLVKFGLKVYKVGILNYSSQGLWKKMWKALKE